MKLKQIFLILILPLFFVACSSDEPEKELSISDLLHSSWSGEQVETLENGSVQKIKFIILFSNEKDGMVTYLDAAGTPLQNFPIYYKIEGDLMSMKGAFEGNYKIVKHTKKMIEMEAYLPNHSIITLYRK
ncbi:hypothetical protein BFS16_03960 [Hoylesella timonensis]|jgi:hypothetical protein|uniref:Lipocalin-like domain-containing protein n=1 Tax=Hoylesella timonensis TaxID=386414 RepID=A0A2K0XLX0_9BACT|nr:hypothetical protein [Hoylesella timonensis]PNP95539.1 hypothetical protein BFS16_03960 [Hoylesella timonensis]